MNPASPYLEDLPSDLAGLVAWFRAGAKPEGLSRELAGFARVFLAQLNEELAVVPDMGTAPALLLVWVITHHEQSPDAPVAWLNLGFCLRAAAACGIAESARRMLLVRSHGCFDRCIGLAQGQNPLLIRALAGKAFTAGALGEAEAALALADQAAQLDPSDPSLWLLLSSCYGQAGREEQALSCVDQAYEAYVRAGRPEGLRYLFEDVTEEVAQ